MKEKEMPGIHRGSQICLSASCRENAMRGLPQTDAVAIRAGGWTGAPFTAPPPELR